MALKARRTRWPQNFPPSLAATRFLGAAEVKAKMAMLAGNGSDAHCQQFASIEVLAKQIATAKGQRLMHLFASFFGLPAAVSFSLVQV